MKLSFKRTWTDDDGMLQLAIVASNGLQAGAMDIYLNPEDLQDFGSGLQGFPEGMSHEVKLESGGEDGESYGYFRMRAFVVDPSRVALEIVMDIRGEVPDCSKSHFYIATEAARLNRLGRSICNWNPSKDGVLEFPQ